MVKKKLTLIPGTTPNACLFCITCVPHAEVGTAAQTTPRQPYPSNMLAIQRHGNVAGRELRSPKSSTSVLCDIDDAEASALIHGVRARGTQNPKRVVLSRHVGCRGHNFSRVRASVLRCFWKIVKCEPAGNQPTLVVRASVNRDRDDALTSSCMEAGKWPRKPLLTGLAVGAARLDADSIVCVLTAPSLPAIDSLPPPRLCGFIW